MYATLALLSVFLFLYSITSKGLEKTWLTGPIIFVAAGLLFGPYGLDLLAMKVDAEGLKLLAELSLALILFSDASNAKLAVLRHSFRIPQRLLLLGLPMTIALGFVAAALLFRDLTLLEAALLATLLAPTDAALGQAVVTNKAIPEDIREGLNVESGLNDGICVPVLLLLLSLAGETGSDQGGPGVGLKLMVQSIGIGALAGIAVTALGGWLLRRCTDRGWVEDSWRQLTLPAIAIACFAVAQYFGGSGFIAAFAGGILFNTMTEKKKHSLILTEQAVGDSFVLITWAIFGAGVVSATLPRIDWQVCVYAVLSLTVIRMLPVYILLAGLGLNARQKLFMGWFGPRGLASVVFVIIVLDESLAGGESIAVTAMLTIMLSVLAHGLSANPLIKWLCSEKVAQKS